MVKKTLTYLEYGNLFCGIEHAIKNGTNTINAMLLKRQKKQLISEATFEFENTEAVFAELPKNQHATLVINNDKVLSKQLQSEQQDALKLVYQAYPNINLEDFYYEVFSETNTHFISLCRKDYVDNLINLYTKHKIYITDVFLGNNVICNVREFLNSNQVFTTNATISIKNGRVDQIIKNDVDYTTYSINGLEVSNEHLLAFSSALGFILKSSLTKTNLSAKKDNLLNDFKQLRFFNQFIKFVGIFILVMLLINFLFFNHYFNEVANLQEVSVINQASKDKIVSLNEVVLKKQKMVDDLLKSKGSKSSFYCNIIIQSLPNSIVLSDYNYQPLNKRIKADKVIDLDINTITISGTSSDSKAFSNWISELEQLDWITKTDILEYGSSSNTVSDFTIKASLSND